MGDVIHSRFSWDTGNHETLLAIRPKYNRPLTHDESDLRLRGGASTAIHDTPNLMSLTLRNGDALWLKIPCMAQHWQDWLGTSRGSR